jgi:hypothetical protein
MEIAQKLKVLQFTPDLLSLKVSKWQMPTFKGIWGADRSYWNPKIHPNMVHLPDGLVWFHPEKGVCCTIK